MGHNDFEKAEGNEDEIPFRSLMIRPEYAPLENILNPPKMHKVPNKVCKRPCRGNSSCLCVCVGKKQVYSRPMFVVLYVGCELTTSIANRGYGRVPN